MLEPLAQQATDEANVHFLLGKCYIGAGCRPEATVVLTTARELQPKFEGAIRKVLLANGEDLDGSEEEDV